MRDLTTKFGLTRVHDTFDSGDDLADQLDKHAVPHTRFDLPNIVGMGGAAWLMGYVSPDTRKHVTALVIPRRYEVDQFGVTYYYFDGLAWDEATATGARARWADLYNQCEAASAIRPGRPEVGPQVKAHLPESVIAAVDALTQAEGVSRSAWIRRCVIDAVQAHQDA